MINLLHVHAFLCEKIKAVDKRSLWEKNLVAYYLFRSGIFLFALCTYNSFRFYLGLIMYYCYPPFGILMCNSKSCQESLSHIADLNIERRKIFHSGTHWNAHIAHCDNSQMDFFLLYLHRPGRRASRKCVWRDNVHKAVEQKKCTQDNYLQDFLLLIFEISSSSDQRVAC